MTVISPLMAWGVEKETVKQIQRWERGREEQLGPIIQRDDFYWVLPAALRPSAAPWCSVVHPPCDIWVTLGGGEGSVTWKQQGPKWFRAPPFFFLYLFLLFNEFYFIYSCTAIITTKFYSKSIPNLQCIPPTPSLSHLETIKFFKVCESVSVLQRSLLCPFSGFHM